MNRMQSAGRSPLVLVVDDHEDTRQMSLIVLRSQGFSAMAAVGGEAGFVCACEQQPDVIVTDLAMPDGDGWEFVQRLASDPRTAHIPVGMVAACAARGTSRLRGAAELRLKESDRLAALAHNLSALGVRVEESADGLAITGGRVRGGTIEAGGDHRVAMAFAVLGAGADGPVTIDDASSISTSFSGFGATLSALGGRLAPADETS